MKKINVFMTAVLCVASLLVVGPGAFLCQYGVSKGIDF